MVTITPADLKNRTQQFAMRILKVVDALPRKTSASVIGQHSGKTSKSKKDTESINPKSKIRNPKQSINPFTI